MSANLSTRPMAPALSNCRRMVIPANLSALRISGSDRCRRRCTMKNIKGVIFDLDGTLADTLPLCVQAFRQSIEPLTSRPLTETKIIATFGPSEEGTIMALAPRHYEQGVASYLQYYETLHDMCPEPFEDIRELLSFLKDLGIRVAMVTGKGPHST